MGQDDGRAALDPLNIEPPKSVHAQLTEKAKETKHRKRPNKKHKGVSVGVEKATTNVEPTPAPTVERRSKKVRVAAMTNTAVVDPNEGRCIISGADKSVFDVHLVRTMPQT